MMWRTSHTCTLESNYLLPGKLLDMVCNSPSSIIYTQVTVCTHTLMHTPGQFFLSDMLAPGFRLPAIYCRYWHTSLLSFTHDFPLQLFPLFFYFLCPSLSLPAALLFLCFYSFCSQWRKHLCLHLSKFLPACFFSTPFKRANTSVIFPLNTPHSFCLPTLLPPSLFTGVNSCSAIWWPVPSLLASPLSWITHRLPDLSPASPELWHSDSQGDRWLIEL